MDGVVHLFYGLWLISNQVRLMFHKSNILGLSSSLISYEPLVYTCRPIYWIDKMRLSFDTIYSREARKYEVQCSLQLLS